jgi:GntR family transcriptional regulator
VEIDPQSHLPLHAQVEKLLVRSMADGALPPGARVPSEDSLVEQYAVSRTTIRTAIQSLIARGLVEIRRGKGTFVTQPVITQELTALTGFVEDMQALRVDPSARVLDRRIAAAGHRCRADSARALGRWRAAVVR